MVQWLRIHLPMQGTRVQALVRIRAPQLLSLLSRARKPQLLSLRATTTEAFAPRAHAPQQEKPMHRNEDPMQPKIKLIKTNRK